MRALDANVLVRYFTADDSKQLAAVESLIHQARTDREPLFVSTVVLCELVWGLKSVFSLSKPVLLDVLDRFFGVAGFEFEHHQSALRALESFRTGKADYSDYLIGEIALASGCRDLVTFDRALRSVPGFHVLP